MKNVFNEKEARELIARNFSYQVMNLLTNEEFVAYPFGDANHSFMAYNPYQCEFVEIKVRYSSILFTFPDGGAKRLPTFEIMKLSKSCNKASDHKITPSGIEMCVYRLIDISSQNSDESSYIKDDGEAFCIAYKKWRRSIASRSNRYDAYNYLEAYPKVKNKALEIIKRRVGFKRTKYSDILSIHKHSHGYLIAINHKGNTRNVLI